MKTHANYRCTFLHPTDVMQPVRCYSSSCRWSDLISSLRDSITPYIFCMDSRCLLSRRAISALTVLVPATCVSRSLMRACRLAGSSAVFRLLSTFENMLRCDEAFAYSARKFSGYKMADFSYASLGACPSTWSAAYGAQPYVVSVLLRRCLTLCACIL